MNNVENLMNLNFLESKFCFKVQYINTGLEKLISNRHHNKCILF